MSSLTNARGLCEGSKDFGYSAMSSKREYPDSEAFTMEDPIKSGDEAPCGEVQEVADPKRRKTVPDDAAGPAHPISGNDAADTLVASRSSSLLTSTQSETAEESVVKDLKGENELPQDFENVEEEDGEAEISQREPWNLVKMALPSSEVTDVTSEQTAFDYCTVTELKLGADVEVKWDIVDDDGTSIPTWFSAKLGEPIDEVLIVDDDEDEPRDAAKIRVYMLHYNAAEEFPADSRKVCFLSDHQLADIEHKEHLVWRLMGSTFEGEPSMNDEEEEECIDTSESASKIVLMELAIGKIAEEGKKARETTDEVQRAEIVNRIQTLTEELMNSNVEMVLERIRIWRGFDLNHMPADRRNYIADRIAAARSVMVEGFVRHVLDGKSVNQNTILELLNSSVQPFTPPQE